MFKVKILMNWTMHMLLNIESIYKISKEMKFSPTTSVKLVTLFVINCQHLQSITQSITQQQK